YAFVLEDPSKPRKYQLNFNLDTEYVKEPTQMDQSISHHQELIPIPPPVSQVTPSAHRHPYHHQPYPYQKQHESLMTSSTRPHLPPLQPSIMETPSTSNSSSFNYTQSVFPNQNNMNQGDKSDRGFHERMDQPNLHPSSIPTSLPAADHQSYQQIQQQQHNQQTQHHHHNHHHNNQQQNLSHTHHYQQKHHHPVITNNSSPSSTVSQ
ncbi:18876_t:CDS:2, partial [Acaulospora morrowiae]